jgi:cobalamin biosynthesis protein CobD/CbiB
MVEWLKRRIESLLDAAIFAGLLAGGGAVLTAFMSLPLPIIVATFVLVFALILVAIRLLKFKITRQADRAKNILPILQRMDKRNRELAKQQKDISMRFDIISEDYIDILGYTLKCIRHNKRGPL